MISDRPAHVAQPFTHLSVPNTTGASRLRPCQERFIAPLRPEDVAAELRRESDDHSPRR
ncbi:hypothetical protein [Nonomuraea sp. NPDC046570]|uniref:hypothetical protein n=1 Tax=Nonomuraea sp. NPDC046570 TaxID=3155255 RepID=UPI0033DF0F87